LARRAAHREGTGHVSAAMLVGAVSLVDGAASSVLPRGSVQLIARVLGDDGLTAMVATLRRAGSDPVPPRPLSPVDLLGGPLRPLGPARSRRRGLALGVRGWAISIAGLLGAAVIVALVALVFVLGKGSSLLYPFLTLAVLLAAAAIRAGARIAATGR